MNSNTLTIKIHRSAAEVFAFTTNPENTSLWVSSISHEETNEWPVKVGTIYKNKGSENIWSEYEMTAFDENKSFTLSLVGGDYHVTYTCNPLTDTTSELEYYEWVDTGELTDPFTMTPLENLKRILEK